MEKLKANMYRVTVINQTTSFFFYALYFIAMLLLCGFTDTTHLTDPTRPPTVTYLPQTHQTLLPLSLTAIFIYPTYRFAIINGQIAKSGDHFGEFIITNISPYTVELTGPQNTKETLELVPHIKETK